MARWLNVAPTCMVCLPLRAGWAPKQLQSEVSRGLWQCVSASPDLVLPRRGECRWVGRWVSSRWTPHAAEHSHSPAFSFAAASNAMQDTAALAREGHDMWARILASVAGPDAVPGRL
jgi:hypothetical protein